LCAAHLAGNALLLLLGYYWLGLGESNAAHLAFSAAVIICFVLAALWLHGTALVLFRRDESLTFAGAAGRALHNLLPLFVLSALVFAVYMLLWHFYESFGHSAFNIGSYSTMKLRRPVEPTGVLRAFHGFIWFLRWLVVPFLAIPLASEVANRGWSGFGLTAFRRSRLFLFWIEAGVLAVAAVHLPLHLFLWVPTMPNFSMEVLSVIVRLGFGYLLFTVGLLVLEFLTSAGSPRSTQVNTVGSP
jgi:hypothetical protein